MLDVTQGRLVGRTAELGRLQSLLTAAAAGQPVVALVGGDAGVGKTRLVTELTAQARERGFTVLVGRCAELADTVPYLPLADALRDATSVPAAAGPVLEALAARPVLSRLLPDAGAAGPVGADLPGLAQQQLFGAVLGMLAELAEASPVLLVLEDLHWADRSTRDLVTFLSRVMHRERLALVVTYRTDDMHRRHPLRPVLAELLRLPGVTSVGLGPLPAAAMAEHLTSIAAEPLDATQLGNLINRAEGNAYYAEELLASSAAECVAAGSPVARTSAGPVAGELPAGLADLLLARMERLSPTAQQVLRAAAVTGRRVDDELVRQVSGLEELEYEEAVREAVAHQLLVPDGGGGYSFRHALLREAIYADLLPGERTRLHASLAALLRDERRLAEVRGSAAELAQHSLASHDIPGAFTASILAAQEAHQLAAPAEAHRHYDQALSLWERVSDPERLAGMDRAKLAYRSAVNAADSGDALRAVQQLRRLLEVLTPDSDPVLYSRASERLAYFLLDIDDDQDAIAAADAAVNALPAEPPSWERARALATHARTLLNLPDTAPAQARAEQAADAAEAADAPWVHADALVTLGLLSEQTGQHDEAIRLLTAADQEAGAGRGTRRPAAGGVPAGQATSWNGVIWTPSSAVAHAGTEVATDAGLGMAPYGLDLQYLHYLAHYADGDWDHAQQLADGFPLRVTNIAEARLSAMALFIDVARGSSGVAVRRAWLEPFFSRDRFAEYIGRGLLAEHALWQGDGDTALAEAEATIKAIEAWDEGFGPPVIRAAAIGLAALADRARQARAAGEHQRAAAAAQAATALVEIARQGAVGKRGVKAALGMEGRGWLARAEAEWRRATGENTPGQWQAVVKEFEPGFVYESARSRWRLAEALVEAGRRDEAEQEYQAAVIAADRLGAVPLQAALASLARRARLNRPAGPAGTRPGGPGGSHPDGQPAGPRRGPLSGLTGRELEVLRLLAAGHSNKEIGAELFIATKTASVHVSNILAKLGAASRTEAAAIAHGEGLGGAAGPASGHLAPDRACPPLNSHAWD